MIRRVGKAGDDFIAGIQVADADVGFAFYFGRERRLQFLRAFKLFVRFGGRERILDGKSGGTQILDKFQRRRAENFILDQNENVHVRVEFWQQP